MRCHLGVNIDHIATLRQQRGGVLPNPLRAVSLIKAAGADGITVHLREDRRHIQEDDVRQLSQTRLLPLHLELAATEHLVDFARSCQVDSCCFVPERRQELTTEGGLDIVTQGQALRPLVDTLQKGGIRTMVFIAADPEQIQAAVALSVDGVELHTGAFADSLRIDKGSARVTRELAKITQAVQAARAAGLVCHAGHGLDYESAARLAPIEGISALNIGHFIIGEAIFVGIGQAVRTMVQAMQAA